MLGAGQKEKFKKKIEKLKLKKRREGGWGSARC